jgi:tripartite-type tricarboxylate transporter receptor subunit TctC
MNSIKRKLGLLPLAALACLAGEAIGQVPTTQAALPKTITIIVPFNPGASNDTFARVLAQKLGPKVGANVIVDNKPGAGGVIGAAYVARAPRDGSVLLLTSSTFTTSAAVQKKLPYDPAKGFAPVALLATAPMILTVGAGTPYKTAADLLADARAHKDKISYGSAGTGSINHLAAALLDSMAKTEMMHVAYKGTATATTDIIGGQIQGMIASPSSVTAHLKSGRMRALAVTSSEPSTLVPGVPTLASSVPGYDVQIWWGLFAPAGTPAPVVDRLNSEIRAIVGTPEMRERFSQEGAEPSTTLNPGQVTNYVGAELDKWRKIAQEKHITAD